jgi:uncharacterized NAD(P)/FAD-binding protein YdhS
MKERPTVAIVGAGASGTLVATQLLRRHHPRGLWITLIERGEAFGPGLAYSTPWEFHRLNVPAGEMGAYPRDPHHFVRWARTEGFDLAPDGFAPRQLFGSYLSGVLADAERTAFSDVTLDRVNDEAIDIAVSGDADRPRVTIALSSGAAVHADFVVLALGNLPPPVPPGCDPDLLASDRYEGDAWDPDLPERAAGEDTVVLLGTGLTMVDVALMLGREGGPRTILAVSRRGLLPRSHRPGVQPAARRFAPLRHSPELAELVIEFDARVNEAQADGGDWREVIDSLRPVTNQIWMRFSEVDRRRFVQHLSRRWDVHRHRMAPEVASMLYRLRDQGRLRIETGAIERVRVLRDRVAVTLASPDTGRSNELVADRVVNCTGPALDLKPVDQPLVRTLFERRLARRGPLHLGLDHDARGALVDYRGASSRALFTIGPMRKGRLWETTAIPEIRLQALELADQLTSALARTPGAAPARPLPSGEPDSTGWPSSRQVPTPP